MASDAVATMGSLLPDDAGGRDAVHVAVFSATSADRLFPGQHVAVIGDTGRDAVVALGAESNYIGIVDPFLKSPAQPGARFWVYLYPRTITALSHRWTHPAFKAAETSYSTPNDKAASEAWLRDFVQRSDCPGYETVLAKAVDYIDGTDQDAWNDECLHFNGSDAHGEIPPEFWQHVEIVLDRKIADDRERPIYFSCAC